MKSAKGMIFLYFIVLGLFVSSAFWGNGVVNTISENTPVHHSICFVIDAGHGGVDGGATSCTGVLESTINLQIAKRLNDLLHLIGYQTRMIRNDDTSIYTEGNSIAQKKISDLKERVRICNTTDCAFLLSIHQNNFPDARYSGAQIFYRNEVQSETYSQKLQREIINHLNPGSKRSATAAKGIYLLENISCPGVLIECGFLSNPEEEARLRNAEYQKKLSCVIASSAARFILDWQTND